MLLGRVAKNKMQPFILWYQVLSRCLFESSILSHFLLISSPVSVSANQEDCVLKIMLKWPLVPYRSCEMTVHSTFIFSHSYEWDSLILLCGVCLCNSPLVPLLTSKMQLCESCHHIHSSVCFPLLIEVPLLSFIWGIKYCTHLHFVILK